MARRDGGSGFRPRRRVARGSIAKLAFPHAAREQDDVFVVPPWTPYSIESACECVLFSYSDRSAQVALGFWREDVN